MRVSPDLGKRNLVAAQEVLKFEVMMRDEDDPSLQTYTFFLHNLCISDVCTNASDHESMHTTLKKNGMIMNN